MTRSIMNTFNKEDYDFYEKCGWIDAFKTLPKDHRDVIIAINIDGEETSEGVGFFENGEWVFGAVTDYVKKHGGKVVFWLPFPTIFNK